MRAWFIACLATLVLASGPAEAENRVALVIGNGAYGGVERLANTLNDANDISASLERLGFKVNKIANATYEDMRRSFLDFSRRAHGADMAIVFFAGHGIEVAGENWLIPIDAKLESDTDVEHEAIALKSVLNTVGSAAKLGLVILDACRSNPFAAKMQRKIIARSSVTRGFTRVEPTDNVLVAYAAKDGTTASDGIGRNSPFTGALLEAHRDAGPGDQSPVPHGARRRDERHAARAAALRLWLAVEGSHLSQGCSGVARTGGDRGADPR